MVAHPLAVADGRQVPNAGAVDPVLVDSGGLGSRKDALGGQHHSFQPHSFIARDLLEEFSGCWLLVDCILI